MTTPNLPPSGVATARLMRRAQAVARLRHPNLVRMLPLPGGAGLAPVLGNAHRLAYFTLPAGTFKRFDLEQVVRLLVDVLSGLAALHEVMTDGEPFVHGSISPQHIYIDEHGTARLVPLLPAHFSANAKPERSGYVAPEKLQGKPVDARADVFSMGVMLWEALSGKRLSADGSLSCLIAPGQRPPTIQLPARLRWAQPLCAIAERAIALEPSARFATALELSQAIERAAAQQLAHVDSDAWQEEAPTPVFQPRVHLAALRTSTPPPAVLSLPTSEEPAPAQLEVPLDVPFDAAEPPRRRANAVVLGLGALALGLALALVPKQLQRVPSWSSLKSAAGAAAAARLRLETRAPAVPLASTLPVLPPRASASVPAPASAAVPASAAAPATRASAAVSASAAVTPSARVSPAVAAPAAPAMPAPAPRPKSLAKPRASSEDYGI